MRTSVTIMPVPKLQGRGESPSRSAISRSGQVTLGQVDLWSELVLLGCRCSDKKKPVSLIKRGAKTENTCSGRQRDTHASWFASSHKQRHNHIPSGKRTPLRVVLRKNIVVNLLFAQWFSTCFPLCKRFAKRVLTSNNSCMCFLHHVFGRS